MNLLQLEYFLTLARFGSFRKTAEHLYVSQPAVSRQISMLEKEWGFPLFERGYRVVTLSPQGKIMCEAIQNIRNTLEEALYQARLSGEAGQVELRLGIPEHSDFANLTDILSGFQQANPRVALKVQQFPISQLLLQHPNGEYDMVINHERNLRNKGELEIRVLARRRHVAIISRHHPLYRGAETRLEDLKGDCLIIDLASKPGGVDLAAAGQLGLTVIWALSLPGKVAPVTAGAAIKSTIYNMLRELGR